MIYDTKDTKIIICEDCNGKGSVVRKVFDEKELDNIRRTFVCKTCNGTGRLEKTTIIKYAAFDPKNFTSC